MSLSTTTAPPAPPQPAGAMPPPRRRKIRLGRFDVKFSPYGYIAPFFIVFGIFGSYPMFKTLYMSFTDWDLVNERTMGHTFIGFDNYVKLLGDPYYWNALKNTIGVFLLATIPQIILALLLANMLNRPLRARMFFRMSILIPTATSVAAVGIIFGTLFQRDFGVINWVLEHIGLERVNWHGAVWAQWTAVATMIDWRWTGYNALILLAGMQAIPRDLYESAAIDGAGRINRFFRITIPQLRPTLIFVIITATIGGLQIFDEPRLYDQNGLGGENQQWMTMTIYLYKLGWTQLNFGRAASVAWLLFVVIVAIGLLNLAITRRIATNEGPAN